MSVTKIIPTAKELAPYIIAMLITAISAMWVKLDNFDQDCDSRISRAEQIWQQKYDRQEARLDTANAVLARMQKENTETFRRYFEAIAKIKK